MFENIWSKYAYTIATQKDRPLGQNKRCLSMRVNVTINKLVEDSLAIIGLQISAQGHITHFHVPVLTKHIIMRSVIILISAARSIHSFNLSGEAGRSCIRIRGALDLSQLLHHWAVTQWYYRAL